MIKYLTFTNWGSLEIALNMAETLVMFGQVNPADIIIEAVDDESYNILTNMGLKYEIGRFHKSIGMDYLNFSRRAGSEYSSLMSFKPAIIKKYYQKYKNLLYIDNDVVFFSPVEEELKKCDATRVYFQNETFSGDHTEKRLDRDFDILNFSSTNEYFCAGFAYYQDNEASRQMIDLACRFDGLVDDDQLFSHKNITKELRDQIVLFDRDKFPNGHWAFVNKSWDKFKVIALHFNWMVGKDKKIEKIISFNKWIFSGFPKEIMVNGRTCKLPELPTLLPLKSTDIITNPPAVVNIEIYNEASPIFILGDSRTGTSFVAKVIVNTLRDYKFCHYEGHLWRLLRDFKLHWNHPDKIGLVERFTQFNFLLNDKIVHNTQNLIQNYISSIYINSFGNRFIDKSPNHVNLCMLNHILESFPNAKIVITKRRCLEAMLSKKRKFPHFSFEDNLKAWIKAHEFIINNSELIKDKCFLIENYDLINKEEEVFSNLSKYLNLNFSDFEQVLSALSTKDKIEKTNLNDYAPLDFYRLTDEEFSQNEKQIMYHDCQYIMDKLGYSWNENYFLNQ